MNNQNTPNCLNISYIFKTSLGSINGSWTEGNVSTVKKITTPNGEQIPYVSGQSLKYQIRRAWKELGLGELLSEVKQTSIKKGVDFTEGDPKKFLDDDLLGYMITGKKGTNEENRRRTAVVRTSAAIGVFPFKNDRDLGVKSKEEINSEDGGKPNLFETEIYYNYFRVNFLIELDRLGIYQDFELAKSVKGKMQNLTIEQKRERLTYLLNAISNIWGGGKQSRLLTDMSPKFLAITLQNAKNPIFLETLTLSENEELNTKAVKEVLEGNSSIVQNSFIGVQSGIFKNDVSAELSDFKPDTIQNTFNSVLKLVETLNF
jgi:CRISPR-associated protein Cst2